MKINANPLTFYKGKLTYTVALLGIAWTIWAVWTGAIDNNTGFKLITELLLVLGIRRAIG